MAPNKDGWGQQPNGVGGIKSCFLSTMHRGKLWNTEQNLPHLPLLFLSKWLQQQLPCCQAQTTHRAGLVFLSRHKGGEGKLWTHYSAVSTLAAWCYVYVLDVKPVVDLVCVCVCWWGYCLGCGAHEHVCWLCFWARRAKLRNRWFNCSHTRDHTYTYAALVHTRAIAAWKQELSLNQTIADNNKLIT